MGWRGGWVLSLLVVGVGCGGELPEEQTETGLVQEPTSAPEVTAEALCLPTDAGTQRVKTILPPSQIGIPRYTMGPGDFEDFQGTLHFAVNYEDGRKGLWRTTGTAAGTTEVKAFPATPGSRSSLLSQLTATPTQLFFQATDAAHGNELWVSDGTTAGTRLVKDVTPGVEDSYLTHLTAAGSTLVFFVENYDATASASRHELWRSDGTTAGTVRVRDFGTSVDVSYLDAKQGNALLFFVRELKGATSLWRTDGTAAGTVMLKRLDAGPDTYPYDVRTSGALTLFKLNESSGLSELWKTDGTAGGTLRLASFGPTRGVNVLGALGPYAYVTTTSFKTQYMVLYRVPLAGGNPEPVVTLPNDYTSQGEAFPYIDAVSQAPGGKKLFFSVVIGSNGPAPRDTQLWVTNGTAGGTTLLRRPLSLSDEYGSPVYAVADNLVFFSAYDSSTGIEPWVSNGTVSGTRLLKNIEAQNSSYPREFFRHGDRVYFNAYDETLNSQLWSSKLSNTCAAPKDAQ
ncbi:ELWxxDGT repeat protein [Corallococcus sp. EGB]|uniref:ELWxxDGT repeat protein n=1 Tax=Corallococcus sp. EGB TaxID=1521117 RepID=UPI001CC181DB|nr:ELWxxDGT repeat protein [Corallococcus sp. EGB]